MIDSGFRETCRSCNARGLQLIHSFGPTPLANAYLAATELNNPEPVYPLDLAFCPHCYLVQITETVPPETLFREYLYFSSFADTTLRHAEALADELRESCNLDHQNLVIELASNDGYLLRHFARTEIPVLGIEPARNVAAVAEEQGIRTLCEFFSADLAHHLRSNGQRADVIIANNVLAHVADLNGFVRGISVLLKDDGVAVFEFPSVLDMVDHCEFDTIYHEHLCYFSLTSVSELFRKHNLSVTDVKWFPIHGGTLRIYASHARGQAENPHQRVADRLRVERNWGVHDLGTYQDFARRAVAVQASLRELVKSLKDGGNRLAAYGAAAKGSTLLNTCHIGVETLDFVVDRNPSKQGLFMPGVRIPISGPERLLSELPDAVLLLAWNFADEILEQQATFRQYGGRFIIPIPQPHTV